MSLPRRRRSRPKGRARLNLVGDFPDNGETVTEILDRVKPASYDGRTWRWGGANDIGLMPAPAAAPPITMAGRQAPWIMTINTEAPAVPMDTRLRRARDFLELEVADLAAQGMLYRIDDAEQVRQRGEDLDERSVIAVTVAKAARHLMGPREPWDPR